MISQLLTSALLSQVMSPAKKIQLMDCQEAYTSQHPCYYQPSKSLKISNPSSLTTIANLFPLRVILQHTEILPNPSQSQKETTLISEDITVPHIVQLESGRLPADYQRTTTGKLYEFSYNFPVAVRWLSHRTISPMDFPMNRHWTYA